MIAGLRGRLETLGTDCAVIDVGGISFRVYLPTSTLSTLGAIGQEVKLHTYLHLKEDGAALYGFAASDELRLFQTLMSVSGIGPKLALAMLSALDMEKLTTAIAAGNVAVLTTVPGIGKKTANRLILELKEKVSAGWAAAAPAGGVTPGDDDVLAALTSLGYSLTEAMRAVAAIPPASNLSLEEKVRLALQYFAGK